MKPIGFSMLLLIVTAPKSPGQPGFGNEFAWPTSDVVQGLGDLRISDLGVVACLAVWALAASTGAYRLYRDFATV